MNALGALQGISAEMVKLGGTRMDEPAKCRVIVDRISHEVEHDRGAMKHAVLQGTYLIEHEYLSQSFGARVVRDAQTINLALGYEMNTIEFAIKDDLPYAIDYLNPAPDFERDRITPFYFSHVVERMAQLVIDRAMNGQPSQAWPRWEEMLGIGRPAGFTGALGIG